MNDTNVMAIILMFLNELEESNKALKRELDRINTTVSRSDKLLSSSMNILNRHLAVPPVAEHEERDGRGAA